MIWMRIKWSLLRRDHRKKQKDKLKEGQIIESCTLYKHYVFILRQWKVRKGFNQKSEQAYIDERVSKTPEKKMNKRERRQA